MVLGFGFGLKVRSFRNYVIKIEWLEVWDCLGLGNGLNERLIGFCLVA